MREAKKTWQIRGSIVPEKSVDNFLDVLDFLAVALLQDVAAMWPLLHEVGPNARASFLNEVPFCDNSLGFLDFKDNVQAAISASAAVPVNSVQALTQLLGGHVGAALNGVAGQLGSLGADVQQNNARLDARLANIETYLGQLSGGGGAVQGGGGGVPLALGQGGGQLALLGQGGGQLALLGQGGGGSAPPAPVLRLTNGGKNDGLWPCEGEVGPEFRMADPKTWPTTHVPWFARNYQFEQHPTIQSLFDHYIGTHDGGGPSVRAMESLYGSSSESKVSGMYDWKSGKRRADMKVNKPRAATSAFSRWKVFYDEFDKGTTVAQLEEQRVAKFGSVLETPDHIKWLQEKFTKDKPSYGVRKARGEKGASTKRAKISKDAAISKAATAAGVGEGARDDDDDDDDDVAAEDAAAALMDLD